MGTSMGAMDTALALAMDMFPDMAVAVVVAMVPDMAADMGQSMAVAAVPTDHFFLQKMLFLLLARALY